MNKMRFSGARKYRLLFLICILAVWMVLCGFAKHVSRNSIQESFQSSIWQRLFKTQSAVSNLEVHYIDVGEGDATLVRCGEHSMLIDAGDNSKGSTIQLYLQKLGIHKLDYLILTHPDSDHIGGADVIITKFGIDTVFMADYKKDNKTYSEVTDALEFQLLKWSTPVVGSVYSLGDASFRILGPSKKYTEPNNASLIIMLQYGDKRFLFTGDAESDGEDALVSSGADLNCDVFKAGHHGSYTSSSKKLLDLASPSYVVISCSSENEYGHPHREALNRFKDINAKVYRTDESGTIIATTDGSSISWNVAASETWKEGKNRKVDDETKDEAYDEVEAEGGYILNNNTKKFHYYSCRSAPTTGSSNRQVVDWERDEIINAGYAPCGRCKP